MHSPIKTNALQHKHKLKPGLVASYDIQPGNVEGLFWFLRFINLSPTYLDSHLQPWTHTGRNKEKLSMYFCIWVWPVCIILQFVNLALKTINMRETLSIAAFKAVTQENISSCESFPTFNYLQNSPS